MNVTFTIPLWGIITLVVTLGTPIIWGLISMYFKQLNMKDQIATLKIEVESQEKSIATLKSDIEAKLDRHKTSSDARLMELNNIMIETKTMVGLLVGDKIKK